MLEYGEETCPLILISKKKSLKLGESLIKFAQAVPNSLLKKSYFSQRIEEVLYYSLKRYQLLTKKS